MEIYDIVKNPIVIAILMGLITYMYMDWKINRHIKKGKKKKQVNLLIPFAVAVVAWFIAFAYSNNASEAASTVTIAAPVVENLDKKVGGQTNDVNIKIAAPVSDTSDPTSFNLVQNGVQIPNTLPDLPDVMLEMK